MSNTILPKLIVIKSIVTKGNAYYMNESEDVRGIIRCEEENVFNPFAKIEVELSKFNPKYVHLRFYHSNKYWRQQAPIPWVVATSDQPVDDPSDESSTLFEPSFDNGGKHVYFTHVQSGGRVRVLDDDRITPKFRIFIDHFSTGSPSVYGFTFVDWDTLVKLPKYITFKGDNGKYLKAVWYDGIPWQDARPYLQFSGPDYNHEYVAYEVFLQPDGHLRIKSLHYGKFWRRSPNWIWADSTDKDGKDIDTLFWPVKVDKRTIALRNAGNNYFCKRLTTEGKTDCLNAGIKNITKEAKLVVEELVLERNINNVRYRMEDARVYDEKPFVAGVGSATNNSDASSLLSVKIAYTDTKSYSFSYTLSVEVGVKTTIETNIPVIGKGGIEISASVTNEFEWEKKTDISKTTEAIYTVTAPPKSRVTVNYVATKGKCSVPFSYTQRDKKSNDGTYVTSEHVDGIFHGVNYYNYQFEQLPFEAL